MIKQKITILATLVMALLLSACGPTIKHLTVEELKLSNSKKIFVHNFIGYDNNFRIDDFKDVNVKYRPTPLILAFWNANAEIAVKVQDYLKKKGWEVVAYHKALEEPHPIKAIIEKMGFNYKDTLKKLSKGDKQAKEIFRKARMHPDNWITKGYLNADLWLSYDVINDFYNKNEYYLIINIFKLIDDKAKRKKIIEQKGYVKLTEGIYKIKKRILFTKDKAADYISTAIIMAIKDIL